MRPEIALYTAAALLALAALPLPYSYYTGARFVGCIAFVYVIYECWRAKAWRTLGLAAVGAVVFNPIVPIHATKVVWAALDLIAGAYLAIIAASVASGFKTFRPPEITVGQVVIMIVAAGFASIFCMTLLAFVLFLATLPADLLGYGEPTRTLRYLYPGIAIASAVSLFAGWVYKSGSSR